MSVARTNDTRAHADAADRSAAKAPLRVLPWSPPGSGLHHSGPGMTAYRMYRRAPRDCMKLTLVHGRPEQNRLLGFLDDVAPHCRASDLFALPSSSEGLPNAMLEAMSSGLPAIGTRISGIVDRIDDGRNGRLVEPTPESVAEAIATLLSDRAALDRCAAAARRTIVDGYGVDAVLDAHEALFRGLISGRTPAEIDLRTAANGNDAQSTVSSSSVTSTTGRMPA